MGNAAFRQARDLLLAHRGDYAAAHREFRWPRLDRFNYALDWFDAELATGPLAHAPALRIVGEGAASRSFAELSIESSRLANGLRALGVRRGDRILLMLGNVVPLWEAMLAAMKLGAIVMPTTSALGSVDLRDRVNRGGARAVIANAADAPKFGEVPGDYLRIAVGGDADGWESYRDAESGPSASVPGQISALQKPVI